MEAMIAMKRCIFLILLLAISLGLCSGCARFYPNESLSVREHHAPFAYRETTETPEPTEPPIPTASNYYQLRGVVKGFIDNGVEHGQVFAVNYSGNIEDDLKRLVHYVTAEEPVCAYATDYFNCERETVENGWMISINAVYRRSPSEIRVIQRVRGNEEALRRMTEALRRQDSSLTLHVSGYSSEDFAAQLRQYALYHPDEIVREPEISISVYPDSGYVRVVEVHFTYSDDRETLRGIRAEVEDVLDSAYHYINYGRTNQLKLRLLFTYLTSRFSYKKLAEASPYSLLCFGIGSSRAAASVVRLLCERTGVACTLVEGTKDGERWYWNVAETEDGFRHIDLHTDAMAGGPLTFHLDSEMEGYEWERAACPACELPETEPDTEASEPASESEETGRPSAETDENP